MKIAICDDEEHVRIYIKNLIGMQNVDCSVMEFSSGGELLWFWRQEDREQVDILFLDISMAGTDGMEAAAQIRELLVHNGNVTRKIPVDDIFYIESSNRKIIISMRDEKIECYGKIGEMESELREGFFRVHKGYLINMNYVESYSRTEVWLKNGSSLPISKYKYQDFIKAYLEYISEDGK